MLADVLYSEAKSNQVVTVLGGLKRRKPQLVRSQTDRRYGDF
jgi:hypothetical protein